MWTNHTRSRNGGRLHPSLSWPVVAGMPLSLLLVSVNMIAYPLITLLVAVSAAAVISAYLWLDQVEPEPFAAKMHAVMWGATVAVSVSLVVNTSIGYFYGPMVGSVISAPVVEELTKGLGIWWMVRKGRIRTGFDGIVYSGLVATGFAAVENFLYYGTAAGEGLIVWTFLLRGVATPFAHPLFTLFTGFGIALAAQKGRAVRVTDFWGLPMAVALHAGWNASILFTGDQWASAGNLPSWSLPVAGAYMGVFSAAVLVLMRIRLRAAGLYSKWIATVAFAYNLNPEECETFSDWERVKQVRRRVPKSKREVFDALHSAIVRLMEYHASGRNGSDRLLVHELAEARRVFFL